MNDYKVYMHKNIVNNKVYIGITSIDPKRRWEGGSGYKYNPYFYNAIKKYGWDNFEHIILDDNLSKDEAEKLEIELISHYKSSVRKFGYNIALGGFTNGKHSDETKSKMSEYANNRTPEHLNKISDALKKKVLQYSTDGELIKCWDCCKDAGLFLGVNYKTIYISASEKTCTVGGYIWVYENADATHKTKDYIINRYNKCIENKILGKQTAIKNSSLSNNKIVYQYNKQGLLINTYKSVTIASETNGFNRQCIYNCTLGYRKTYKGFIWSYEDLEKKKKEEKKAKATK